MINLTHIGGKKWMTGSEIKHTLHNGKEITIPKYFKTDLSSVPRFLWWPLPPYGDFLLAAIVHDYLYVNQTESRSFSDKEMLIVSNKINKNKIDNYTRYFGVRLFGWYYWKYYDI